MDNIVVITQNLVLESLSRLKTELVGSETLIVSTQYVLENEVEIINSALGVNCNFLNFADLLSDADREKCDVEAFNPIPKNVGAYYARIKKLKNERIVKKLLEVYPCRNLFLVCDDLGIDGKVWCEQGFKKFKCDYYHNPDGSNSPDSLLRRIPKVILARCVHIKNTFKADIWESYSNGKKYLFFGSLNRIGYRINLKWKKASKLENLKYLIECACIKYFHFMPQNKTVRMSSFHEDTHWNLHDHPNFNTKKYRMDIYLQIIRVNTFTIMVLERNFIHGM